MGLLKPNTRAKSGSALYTANTVTVNTNTGRVSLCKKLAETYLDDDIRIGCFVENNNEFELGGTQEKPKVFIFFTRDESISYKVENAASVVSNPLCRAIQEGLSYQSESGRFTTQLGQVGYTRIIPELNEEVAVYELTSPKDTMNAKRTIDPVKQAEMLEKRKATLQAKTATPVNRTTESRPSPFRRP